MKALTTAASRVAAVAAAVAAEQPKTLPPLSIAHQGYFFAGGKYSRQNNQTVMSGQLYVEFQIPAKRIHPWPIVMIHGGGQTGTNFTGTPDGREGWAQFFLREGYACQKHQISANCGFQHSEGSFLLLA